MPRSRPIKFGYLAGPIVSREYPVAASEVFKHLGGCFGRLDANRRFSVAGAGATELIGWGMTGDYTASATAGNTLIPVNISTDALYLLPVSAIQTETQLKALRGKTCDLIVTSNIQYAIVTLSTEDTIQIVDYEYYDVNSGGQGVVVRLTPSKIGATGVV